MQMVETPSEGIIRAANLTASATDKDGRVIVVKKLTAVERMRLAEVVGGENVKNDVYYGYASLAYHVQEIGGNPVPRPSTRLALEGVVTLLGDEGLEAVGEAIRLNFLPGKSDDTKESIKNL